MPSTSVGSPDEDCLGLEDDRAEDLETGLSQRRARLDDIGDGIRHAEAHGGLDGAVQRHEIGGDIVLVEEAVHETRVGRRDADALEVGDIGEACRRGGEAERGCREPERLDLSGARHPCVQEQVAPGDPDVEGA